MTKEHRTLQDRIRRKYRLKYDVSIETQAKNMLPSRENGIYHPDVVLRSCNGKIKYIIEIEGRPTRKSIAGACMLADYAVGRLRQHQKATLVFVVFNPKGVIQIPHYIERANIARTYMRHLANIKVVSKTDFWKMTL